MLLFLLQAFTVEVSEEFYSFIEDGSLAVEVWGHRRSGFHDVASPLPPTDESELLRPKSFPER